MQKLGWPPLVWEMSEDLRVEPGERKNLGGVEFDTVHSQMLPFLILCIAGRSPVSTWMLTTLVVTYLGLGAWNPFSQI